MSDRPIPSGGKNIVIGTRTWLGPEWTHVDIDPTPLRGADGLPHAVDVVADAHSIPLPSNGADLVYSQECLEHFSWRAYFSVLAEWARLVAPGGKMIVEVPDFLAACNQVLMADSLEMDRAIQQIIFGGQDNEWDYHFMGHTPRTLTDDFERLNFDDISVERGWDVGYLRVAGVKRA